MDRCFFPKFFGQMTDQAKTTFFGVEVVFDPTGSPGS
jgi:hypothetical protein